MAITEVFTHNQPLGNSDPAHTAYGPGELTASTPAMTPLMLDATSGKLAVWDGAHAGAAMGILAVTADQNSVLKMSSGHLPSPTTTLNVTRSPVLQSASFNPHFYNHHHS